jgi:hypothetical protein
MARLSPRIEAEVSRAIQERLARLRSSLDALTDELLDPAEVCAIVGARLAEVGPLPETEECGSSFLAETVTRLASAGDQIALLDRLLEGASRCGSRVVIFVVRSGTARGWSSVGLPEDEEADPAKALRAPLSEGGLLADAVEHRRAAVWDQDEEALAFLPPPRMGDRAPRRALAVPIVIQGQVSALLYADDGGDAREVFDPGSIEVLAGVAALAAGLLALRSIPQAEEPEVAVDVRVEPEPRAGGDPAILPFPGADPLDLDLDAGPTNPPDPGVPEGLSPEETRRHEEAWRFARLLVSELLLYHEDRVVLGRRNRDLYRRLREEIDRSRETYDRRVPQGATGREDYFTRELVRTLAGGDSAVLGVEFPRPAA